MLRISKSRNYSAPVVFRALDILELLFQHHSPMKLDQIADRTGVARSSAYRILGSLEQRGYVFRSLDGWYGYCGSKSHPPMGSKRSNGPSFIPSSQQTKEALWVEHTIETLIALLEESRRGNTIPMPSTSTWQSRKAAELPVRRTSVRISQSPSLRVEATPPS